MGSYGGFKLKGSGYPQIFSAPIAAKLCGRPPTVLEVQERARGPLSPCEVWWGSLSFLSVCMSVCFLPVRHAFERQSCAPDFAMKANWSTETILMPLDRGRFAVVHPCSTFSDCCQLATPLNAEIKKTQKLKFFAARGRQNKPIERKFGT